MVFLGIPGREGAKELNGEQCFGRSVATLGNILSTLPCTGSSMRLRVPLPKSSFKERQGAAPKTKGGNLLCSCAYVNIRRIITGRQRVRRFPLYRRQSQDSRYLHYKHALSIMCPCPVIIKRISSSTHQQQHQRNSDNLLESIDRALLIRPHNNLSNLTESRYKLRASQWRTMANGWEVVGGCWPASEGRSLKI